MLPQAEAMKTIPKSTLTITLKPNVPALDTSDVALAYISALKPGEQVIECGRSCMWGIRGTVYLSASDGGICVMWAGGIGTSVTHGTRRISDVEISDSTLHTPHHD